MSDTLTASGTQLTGYALVFGAESGNLGGFVETIAPDALDRTRAERPDLRALVDHDSRLLIGRTSSGTLKYAVDAKGLKVTIDPPNTQAGRDVTELVRRRDISGMSFAFVPLVDDWTQDRGRVVRTLRDMAIREVSAVTWPAYPAATISTDGRSACRHEEAAVERWNSVKTLADQIYNRARVDQVKTLASGTVRCALCKQAVAEAVRSALPMCRACLTAGDTARQRSFRETTERRGSRGRSIDWHRKRLRTTLAR